MKRHLFESATLQIEDPTADTWPVLVISEGRGSSGVYSGQLLERYHHAFDDALSFNNHPTSELQSRDWTMIAGEIVGETWIQENEAGQKEVWANYRPDPDHREKLSRYKNKLGLSIFIEGDGSVDHDGNFLVESFNESDPYKSVDVVIAAGRGGKFAESLRESYEAQLETSNKPDGRSSAQENRKDTQDMDEVTEALKALTTAVNTLVERQEKAEESQTQVVEADKVAAERVAKFAESIKAIDGADLFESQRTALKEAAERGEDVTARIEEAKAIHDEAKASFTQEQETHGRVLGEGAYSGPTAWGNK